MLTVSRRGALFTALAGFVGGLWPGREVARAAIGGTAGVLPPPALTKIGATVGPSGAWTTTDRLFTLCKVWGVVKVLHPYLAYRTIDWDAALVAALPAARAATDPQGFADAVGLMLAKLDDPATRIAGPEVDGAPSAADPHPIATRTEDGILVVTMTNYKDFELPGADERLTAIAGQVGSAHGVVFDLRRRVGSAIGAGPSLDAAGAMARQLRHAALVTPGRRTRLHGGLVPQGGIGSATYYSAFTVLDGGRVDANETAPAMPIVFVVNRDTLIPPLALALQDAGAAAIIAEDGCDDRNGVFEVHSIDLDGAFKAQIRLGELVWADGTGGIVANRVVARSPAGAPDAPLEAALALARNFAPPPVARPRLPASVVPRAEDFYPDKSYPPLEYRLLALFRIHTLVDYFFPHKALMGEDWDQLLRDSFARFEGAADAQAYALAVAELHAHVHDSHGFIISAALRDFFGKAGLPVRLAWIENAAVVTQVLGGDASTGLAVGDVILSIDGEDVRARMDRLGRYIAASTPQARDRDVFLWLLNGPEGSDVRLTIRDAQDQQKELVLRRRIAGGSALLPYRDGDVWRWLSPEVGYTDLDRLEVADVDAMFSKFASARAIVFDMRGYPKGTAWNIAPRLTERTHVPAALFKRPRVTAPTFGGDAGLGVSFPATTDDFFQLLPPPSAPRYAGLTLMLIDERTQSQAEHTGLFLKAANGTVFIGSPTAGADGDITSFVLPGDVTVMFTGQAVTHPDGRQLQRVGLVPDVAVRPTIQGIRQGRDEVLEAALAYIQRARQ